MGVYRFRSGDDFIIRGIQLPIADIILDCSRKQEIVLGHDTHLMPQAFNGYLTDIMAVNIDMALLDIIETADQINNGGFTRTCRAYQSNGFSRTDMEAHLIQDFGYAVIGKSDLIEHHISLYLGKLLHIILIGDSRGGIHNFKYPFRTCYVGYHLVIEIAQVHNRMPEHGNISSEGNKGTDGHLFRPDYDNSCEIKGNNTDSPAKIDD